MDSSTNPTSGTCFVILSNHPLTIEKTDKSNYSTWTIPPPSTNVKKELEDHIISFMMLALYGLPHKHVDTHDKIMGSSIIPTMTSNSFALLQNK